MSDGASTEASAGAPVALDADKGTGSIAAALGAPVALPAGEGTGSIAAALGAPVALPAGEGTGSIAGTLDELGASVRVAGRRRRRSARSLGLAFLGAGINHFVMPRAYQRIVPPSLKRQAHSVVVLSGVAEIAGGLGVLLPWTRRPAGLGLIALLAAVFPANLYMARSPEQFRKIPKWALYARLPLQPLMMWWAWTATRPPTGAD